MNNENSRPKRGHGPAPAEKPKDLKLAIKKLFGYLDGFKKYILIALILAALSSVFSIIGPNKISDLTDYISKGLIINQKNLKKVTESITSDLTQEKIMEVTNKLFDINTEEIFSITSSNIPKEDLVILNEFVRNKNFTELLNLSESSKEKIFKDSEIDGIFVSGKDKISFINMLSSINNNDKNEMSKTFMNMPKSILTLLCSDTVIDDVKITKEEKAEFISLTKDINTKSSSERIYKTLDKSPKSIKKLIKPTMDLVKIKKLCLFLIILYLTSALFNFVQSFIMATVSNNFAKSLRTKISKKINKLPLKYFDTHEIGDVLSRVTNDVDTIGMSMYQSLGSLVGAITLFIGSIIMMFYTNFLMAITAILSSLIGFIFMFIILGKSQKYFLRRQVELGKLNGHIEEIYSSHNIVKAYNGEENSSEKFDKLNESVYDCNRKSQFLSGLMMPFMSFIGNFSYVAVCIVGALLVINNQITFGVIMAFIIYVRLFTSPLSQIAQGMTNLQTTAAASERVFEFLEENEMDDESDKKKYLDPSKVSGNISFEHVKFGYDENKTIIKDFSLDVKKGDKIAIVGPTGAGKTTMVNLLMKFYNINSGSIKIDGIDINELTRENIHELFIMVLQDTWLFNGTIRDNIKYNKKSITDEEIFKALEVVGVDHFVKSLPKMLDYEITDNESISAGQKQLLTIARGMIENAPFLILDEATSSVDTRTEELVQNAMDKLTVGRTSFIIAHRLSTIKNATKILVMNEGNIIEQGTHEELLKLNGFYADLYNSQFKKDNN